MLIQTPGMNQDFKEGILTYTDVCFYALSLIYCFLHHLERVHLLPTPTHKNMYPLAAF